MKGNMIFLHLPKTAGTSLTSQLTNNVAKANAFFIKGSAMTASLEEFKNLSKEERSKIKLLAGHQPFGMHQFIPSEVKYITILRDPVERVLSYYSYIKNMPNHYMYNSLKECDFDLERFLDTKPTLELNNGQVRLLFGAHSQYKFGECPRAMLDIVMHNLDNYFSHVGVLTYYNEFVDSINKDFNLNIKVTKQNSSKNRLTVDDISSALYKKIIECNLLDVVLYEHILKKVRSRLEQKSRM